jgi:hypothetical protein
LGEFALKQINAAAPDLPSNIAFKKLDFFLRPKMLSILGTQNGSYGKTGRMSLFSRR